MIDYAKILSRRYVGSEWILDGDEYTGLTWLSDTPKPTKAKLDSLWVEVQQEIVDDKTSKAQAHQAVLNKLGLTSDEAAALLG